MKTNNNSTRLLLRSSASAAALLLALGATPAFAQESTAGAPATTPTSEEGRQPTDIVVTGSRIARPEVDSPVPIAVVDSQQLAIDAQQNISDTLNELPQVGLGSTRTNTNFLTSGTGIATVNLRALGSSRTLVLVNGRRFVGGFGGDTAVDLNNIPTDFLERVEVVTGGSSAVYGSDAVAGVVNFVLKDRFEGIQVRAQSTITEMGDNPRYLASITGGTTFGADQQGNVLLNFTYDTDEGLFSRKRGRSSQDCANLVCGPASYSSYAAQGRFQLINPDGGATNAFGGQSLFTFAPDNSLVAGFPIGSGFNRNSARYISTPVERYLASGIANFDVTDNIEIYVEGTYAKVKSNSRLEAFPLDALDIYSGEPGDVGIPITNPFIPAAIQAAIAARNSDGIAANDVAGIQFRRRQNEVFDRSNTVDRDTIRAVAGVRGDLTSKFKYDVSYVYGHVNDFNASEDIDNQRYRQALNAVRVGPGNVVGTDIVCADPAARAAGCIPINLFGFNTADPRASAYVQAVVPKSEEITNKQHVVTASVSGSPFALWAGDVGIAVGFEYRKESVVDDLDILTNTGGNSGNQIPDLVGSQNVKEVFGEINLPLYRDGFINYFGLIGAARYSDYSTIGGVFSWNAGAELEVFDGLRFRGVYAVANRAPNNTELFSQPSETFAAVSDPCDGVTATSNPGGLGAACRAIPGVAAQIAANGVFEYSLADIQGINGFVGGNINLQEETAKTYTLGGVLSPRFLPGFSLSVDYYNIEIEDAVGTLGRSASVENCLQTGLPVFCNNVFRNATTGFVTRVDGQSINVARLQTSGIDVQARYNRQLGLLDGDNFSFLGNYTYLINYKSQPDPSSPVDDFAGTFGPAFSEHRFSARATYQVNEFSFSWQTTFLSGGPFILDFTNANPAVEALNQIDDYVLHDIQFRWDLDRKFSFFVGVDNLFDKQPPFLPGTPFGTPTGLETGAEFDVIGRRFTAGTRFRF